MIDQAGGLTVALAATGGIVIGFAYFATLWWTVRRMSTARHPALLVAGTFLVRAGGAAVGIVLVSRGEIVGVLAAVAGFLVARTIMIRIVGNPISSIVPAAAGSAPTKAGSPPHGTA